jgi:hypothetical protein
MPHGDHHSLNVPHELPNGFANRFCLRHALLLDLCFRLELPFFQLHKLRDLIAVNDTDHVLLDDRIGLVLAVAIVFALCLHHY